MTLMMVSGVIVDVIDQNQAAVRTPDVVRSQMNFKRWTLILRWKLAILSPEIGSSIISVDQFEIGLINIFDLDR